MSTAEATQAPPAQSAAEAFIEAFTEGWRAPRDADSFADHFDPWLTDDVRLVQPQLPVLVGREAFREQFARPLFSLMPDLHGTVESWAADGDVVLVELRLEGTLGGRPVNLATIDKVTLRDGRVAERVAFLDPTALLAAVATRPRSWPQFLRIQASRVRAGLTDGSRAT